MFPFWSLWVRAHSDQNIEVWDWPKFWSLGARTHSDQNKIAPIKIAWKKMTGVKWGQARQTNFGHWEYPRKNNFNFYLNFLRKWLKLVNSVKIDIAVIWYGSKDKFKTLGPPSWTVTLKLKNVNWTRQISYHW